MADAALRRLGESPLNQNTVNLLGQLFARPGQDSRTLDMGKTRLVLRQVVEVYRNETIYCNHDRFQLIDAKKKIYRDTTNNVVLHFNDQSCRGRILDFGEKIALAVTVNPVRQSDTIKNGEVMVVNQPTQIQLCPWFVDWVKDHKLKLHNDAARSNIGRVVIKLAESSKFGFAQIDAFSLLDKVLLHEMTHGRAAYGRQDDQRVVTQEGLVDVPAQTGFFSLPLIRWASYGWKLAKDLARVGDPLGGENAPDNNSDTLALFGSGT
ncbi:hypothetical protein N0V83_000308 [Neocucurbitaria cava]|uniref:Lysine-specific metallo-endopeptidase domain-containing protein n=1 Tax=Neocucurbitaria cava TaxID=798079 RepID=A0A9W9CRV7_9PLEO|nr:hypothetical protein N0V83_000308 [Neocucurbitaria cava]